jgi:sugar O-acyltransferase (sialic acid O-acetyltransferase NeuD family)
MKDLIILEHRHHAGEMADIVERVNQVKPTWNLLGYLSRSSFANADLPREVNGHPVLGTFLQLDKYPDAWLIPSFAFLPSHEVDPRRLATLIDPTCFVSHTATIGPGCVLYPHCFVGLDAKVGTGVFCLSGAVINHDDVVGDHATFASGARLAGNVHVEHHAYLGQGCTVRQDVRIGEHALIGTGAVVLRNVEPYSVMVGNPARKLRDRRMEQQPTTLPTSP